ncbi:hypothetical protein [Niabella sp.]|uniref:hypothetical protein n=1 Tax=Niabella sp. TaxID=1962976 RepID=UPI0026316ED3|nr:hypothetical protein [Niabella sp.]
MANIILRYSCLAIMTLLAAVATKAQKLIKTDIAIFVQSVPQLPCLPEEVHRRYTKTTKHGEEFSYNEALNPPFEKVNAWIADIHDEEIKRKIRGHPRKDMSYKVQYDDEKLKLMLRPPAGPLALKKAASLGPAIKNIVSRLAELEKNFDWQSYYKQYDGFQKELIQKTAQWESKNQKLQDEIPVVQTEYGLQKDEKKQAALSAQMIREKTLFQNALYSRHCVAWSSSFQKYSKSIAVLQQLLLQINYGQQLSPDTQQLLLPLMADVQARALESIERMIWMEMILLERGEILFNEQRIGHFFMRK